MFCYHSLLRSGVTSPARVTYTQIGGFMVSIWTAGKINRDWKHPLKSALQIENLAIPLTLFHLGKLTLAHLVKRDSTFYGSRRFTSVHKRQSLIPAMGKINPVITPKSYSFKNSWDTRNPYRLWDIAFRYCIQMLPYKMVYSAGYCETQC